MFTVRNRKARKYFIGRRTEQEHPGVNIYYSVPIKKTEKKGQKIARDIESLLRYHNMNRGVQLMSCRDVIETAEAKKIMSVIRNYASQNESLNADIEQQIDLMLSNTKRLSQKSVENINKTEMALLRKYMIEEIAFFLALYQEGYTTKLASDSEPS